MSAMLLLAVQSAAIEPKRARSKERSIDQCIADHISSQELRQSGRLLESRERSHHCAASHCPGQLRIDCLDWINQLNTQIPSLSFLVLVEGHRKADVRVFLDDRLVLTGLTGKALTVNPGSHEIRVEVLGFSPHRETVLINEGEQFRNVVVEFKSPTPLAIAQATTSATATSTAAAPVSRTAEYILAGVGILASANAIGWGIYATSGKNKLESECSPYCRQASVDIVEDRGLLADISLGVGLASFAAAAVVYFYSSAPNGPLDSAQREGAQLDITMLPNGGVLGSIHSHF